MKASAKMILSSVPEDVAFVLHHSGAVRKIYSLVRLQSEIEHMSEKEFLHHVSETKNDFSSWIREVFKDDLLAHDVKHAKTRHNVAKVIRERIALATEDLERENKKIVGNEIKRIHALSAKHHASKKINAQKNSSPEFVAANLAALEKDVKKISENLSVEEDLLKNVEDSHIKPWDELNPVHPHARIIEFIFGLAIGVASGLILAVVLFG